MDIGRGDAVVVDDRHAVEGCEQVRVLHPLGTVDVHHDEERAPVGAQHGLGPVHEHVPVFRLLAQRRDQAFGGVFLLIGDDVGAHAEFPCQAAHADRRADRVEVREAVAHDDHARGVAHELAERGRHHAGFDLGPALDLRTAAAEEVKAQAVFHNGLVAAARERQLRRHHGELHVLLQGGAVRAEADGQRRVHARRARDPVRLLEDREALILERREPAAFKDREIPVPVVAAQDRLALVRPRAEHVLHRVAQVVLHALRLVFHQLVEIVDDDDAGHGAAVVVLHADAVIFRDVHPIGDAHEGAGLVALLRADDVAVELILPAIDLQQRGVLAFALEQPLAREAGHGVGYAGVETRAGAAAHLEEHLVAPDDARVRQAEHGDRQREVHERVVLGVLRVIGHRLDIGGQLLFAAAAEDERVDDQQQDDPALGDSEVEHVQIVHLEKKRCRRKEHEKEQVQSRAGLGQSFERVVHIHSVLLICGSAAGESRKAVIAIVRDSIL